ncbi:Glutamyl Aminopeptidase [Manis pentadactyla]|nr:Glutamyl Aminopeptidase [Manis pentadactyla]
MFHIFFTLLFRDDEKTKVLRNLQRYLPSHMAKEAVTKVTALFSKYVLPLNILEYLNGPEKPVQERQTRSGPLLSGGYRGVGLPESSSDSARSGLSCLGGGQLHSWTATIAGRRREAQSGDQGLPGRLGDL